jgi:crossover junction endodeoxyribonuclease RuvC
MSAPALSVEPTSDRVVGIDPGLNVTGYAVIERGRTSPTNGPGITRPIVLEAGVIRAGRAASVPLTTRLDRIYKGILEVIDAFAPSSLALEQVHAHPAHPRTAILMAHARGVIMLAAAQRGLVVVGYSASRIKKTLTGNGKAPKEQIQHAIQLELGLNQLPEPHDVADACAVAICHYQTERHRRAWLDPLY